MKVRVGVIGTGAIGADHARRLSKVLVGAEVVALTDVNRENAEKVKANLGLNAEIYGDGHELIAAGDVDAVLALLREVGAENDDALGDPAPRALFRACGPQAQKYSALRHSLLVCGMRWHRLCLILQALLHGASTSSAPRVDTCRL